METQKDLFSRTSRREKCLLMDGFMVTNTTVRVEDPLSSAGTSLSADTTLPDPRAKLAGFSNDKS